jgi:hypothetical protein
MFYQDSFCATLIFAADTIALDLPEQRLEQGTERFKVTATKIKMQVV